MNQNPPTDPTQTAGASGRRTPSGRRTTGRHRATPTRPRPADVLRRTVRLLLGAALLTGCALLVYSYRTVLTWEARATVPVMEWMTQGAAMAFDNIVAFGVGTPTPRGLRITPECTALVLITPILLFTGLLLAWSRIAVARLAVAGTAGLIIAAAVSQLRVGMIGYAVERWGFHPGYDVAHKYVGPALALAGFALAILTMMKIIGGRRRRTPA